MSAEGSGDKGGKEWREGGREGEREERIISTELLIRNYNPRGSIAQWLRESEDLDLIPTLSLTSSVAFSKLLNLSLFHFPHPWVTIIPTSEVVVGSKWSKTNLFFSQFSLSHEMTIPSFQFLSPKALKTTLDFTLFSLTPYIQGINHSRWHYLQNTSRIWPLLTTPVVTTLGHVTISFPDFGHSLLTGLPPFVLAPLRSVLSGQPEGSC